MIYLQLAFEFFKIGLFSIGGGMATLPFLMDLTKKYNWYTASELANIVAISESTPGPVGVNMATYAGYNAAGIPGCSDRHTVSDCTGIDYYYYHRTIFGKFQRKSYCESCFLRNPSYRCRSHRLCGMGAFKNHARHSHKWCDKDQLLESCLMHHFLRAYADQKTGKTSPAVLDRCRSRSRYYLPALNG